jgi:hypothetical protein
MAGSGKQTAGKVALGCGGLLFLISVGVTLFCAFHVFIDPRGAISRSEAMPGFLAGGFFSFIFLVVMVIGAVLSKKPAAAPMAAGPGGAIGDAGAAASVAASAAQGAGGAAPAKPFPTHLLVGCGTVAIALMSCSSCSSGAYFFDKASTYDRLSSYGSSYSSYGSGSSFMDYYYQAKAKRYRTYGGVSIGLGLLLLLGTIGLGVGTAMAAKKHKAKLAQANESKV